MKMQLILSLIALCSAVSARAHYRFSGDTCVKEDYDCRGGVTWEDTTYCYRQGVDIEQALDEAGKRDHIFLKENDLYRPARAHAHHSKRGPAWCLVTFTSSLQEESGFGVVNITPWSVHSIAC
ncbi:hypothetical protein KXX21_007549 [Aspergillus fumigatus]|nr:hypothetical protein KXX21_007549 [Aspergillus fumigatus]